MDANIFNSVFWLSITSMVLGSFAITLKYCLKSKCSETNLCYGLINFKRDTKIEEEIELRQPQQPQTPTNPTNQEIV